MSYAFMIGIYAGFFCCFVMHLRDKLSSNTQLPYSIPANCVL